MRIVHVIAITSLLLFAPIGQSQSLITALTPNPLSIALSVGQWLIKDSRKVYYVQVESTAKTAADARAEGFKLAVSQAVGTVVVAETEVKNDELIRKEIIQYSSGYVEDFKILKESQVGDMIRIVMDVWVGESKIADRLLNTSNAPGSIEGAKVATQFKTNLNEKQSGDQLLTLVLNDFPERAFDIGVGKTQTQLKARSLEIYIPITISWNRKYIDALYEVLVKTRESEFPLNRQSQYGRPLPSIIMIDRKKDWFPTYAGYTDSAKQQLLERYLIATSPSVQTILKDESGKEMHSFCLQFPHMSGAFFGESAFGYYQPDRGNSPGGQFFSSWAPSANFAIYGDYVLNRTIVFTLEKFTPDLENLKSVEVRVVKQRSCKKSN